MSKRPAQENKEPKRLKSKNFEHSENSKQTENSEQTQHFVKRRKLQLKFFVRDTEIGSDYDKSRINSGTAGTSESSIVINIFSVPKDSDNNSNASENSDKFKISSTYTFYNCGNDIPFDCPKHEHRIDIDDISDDDLREELIQRMLDSIRNYIRESGSEYLLGQMSSITLQMFCLQNAQMFVCVLNSRTNIGCFYMYLSVMDNKYFHVVFTLHQTLNSLKNYIFYQIYKKYFVVLTNFFHTDKIFFSFFAGYDI